MAKVFWEVPYLPTTGEIWTEKSDEDLMPFLACLDNLGFTFRLDLTTPD